VVQRSHLVFRTTNPSLLHGHESWRRLRLFEGAVRTDRNDADEECDLQRHQGLLHQTEDTEAGHSAVYTFVSISIIQSFYLF